MTTDPFTEAARTEATSRARRVTPGDTAADWSERMLMMEQFRQGAEWARTHLAAQEPTEGEIEAAARAIHINTIREFDDLGGLDQHALRTRARKALSAASAARRDEEKR